MAPSLWDRNPQLLLFVGYNPCRLHITKSAFVTNVNANSTVFQTEEAEGNGDGNGNGNGNNRSGDYDMTGRMIKLCKEGLLKEALHFLRDMSRRGIPTGFSTYASLLQECVNQKALVEGKLIHAHMICRGINPDISLDNHLVIMYAKCGSLVDARKVLEDMRQRNVVSWTAMIAAYARHGFNEEALALYYRMQREGIQPNKFTFAGVLPACANMAALKDGKEIHEGITRGGFQCNVFVASALVDMYAKCGSAEHARQVFDEMSERNIVSWNAMIAGYVQNEQVEEALKLFQKMPERNVISWTAMIAGYAQNGHFRQARELFQRTPKRNVVSWTAMIAAYATHGYNEEALSLYYQMQLEDIHPNMFTFAAVLPACANMASLRAGKEIHEDITRSGFQCNVFVGSALIDMYAKCGSIENAHHVFNEMPERNVVLWNAMIAGYAQNGHVDEALKLFYKIPEKDVVSWTTMIAGYAQNGQFNEALKLFQQMQLTGVKPDSVTFTSILPACANLAALINGKEVHENIIKRGFQSHLSVWNSLVDMYAKCGTIEDARQAFDEMHERDVVSWNVMIVGYAKHGRGKEALQLFEEMQHFGTSPNHVTFIGVLSACSHAGLVDNGRQYFDSMSPDYHITPAVEHYCCMVDLLGRAGHLDEAHDFINKMPIKPHAAVWASLLGACRIHTNIELGEHVAERLFELDPNNAACYVLMSNIYSAAGRWDDAEKVRKMMRDRRVTKIPGCSWIEVNNKVYSFPVRDKSHLQTHKIYAELERLSWQLKDAGYVPKMNSVVHGMEEEEDIHCHWSQKLATAF